MKLSVLRMSSLHPAQIVLLDITARKLDTVLGVPLKAAPVRQTCRESCGKIGHMCNTAQDNVQGGQA